MKRISKLLIAVMLMVTMFATSAYAATTTVTASNVTGKTGSEVTVSFNISGNTGFAAMDAKINYDSSKLELVSISKGAVLSDASFVGNVAKGKVATASASDMTGNGTLFTAKFKILGGNGTYTVTPVITNMTNENGVSVSAQTSSANVTVHNHSFGSAWNKDANGHWHNCACGEKDTVEAHTYGNWKVVKEAKVGEKGLKERACTVCGYTQTADIAALSSGGSSSGGSSSGSGSAAGGSSSGTATTPSTGGTVAGGSDSTLVDSDAVIGDKVEDTDTDDADDNDAIAGDENQNTADDVEGEGGNGLLIGGIIAALAAFFIFFLIAKRKKDDEDK